MARKHLISVCAAALMAGTVSPARAGDNGPAVFDPAGLVAFDGEGGTGSGVSTAGVPGPAPAGGTNGYDGTSGGNVSTGFDGGGGIGGGSADGGGGVSISTGLNNGAPPPAPPPPVAPPTGPPIGYSSVDGGGGNSPGI